MKNLNLLSSALLVSLLLTGACTPADKAVTDTATRTKIQEMKLKKGRSGEAGKLYRIGSFQGALLLMDKQTEAIEWVRLALQLDDGLKSNIKFTDKNQSADGTTAKLSQNTAPLHYGTSKGEFVTTLSKSLKVETINLNQENEFKLRVSNLGVLKQGLDRHGGKKSYVNVSENLYELTAAASEKDKSRWVIQVKSSGTIKGLAQDNRFEEKFELKLMLEVDRESLKSGSVIIYALDGDLGFKKEDGKIFSIGINGKDLDLEAEGLCNDLNGSAKIKTDKNGRTVQFEEREVSITGTEIKINPAPCGQRPTVDISRLLPL